jgi:hypothetical protein
LSMREIKLRRKQIGPFYWKGFVACEEKETIAAIVAVFTPGVRNG